jgi:hypothetical protein
MIIEILRRAQILQVASGIPAVVVLVRPLEHNRIDLDCQSLKLDRCLMTPNLGSLSPLHPIRIWGLSILGTILLLHHMNGFPLHSKMCLTMDTDLFSVRAIPVLPTARMVTLLQLPLILPTIRSSLAPSISIRLTQMLTQAHMRFVLGILT